MKIFLLLVAFIACVSAVSSQRVHPTGNPPNRSLRRLRPRENQRLSLDNSHPLNAPSNLSPTQFQPSRRREYVTREAVPIPLPLEPRPEPLPSRQASQSVSPTRERNSAEDLVPYRPRPESLAPTFDFPVVNRNSNPVQVKEEEQKKKFQVFPQQPIYDSRRRQRPSVFKEDDTIYRKRPTENSRVNEYPSQFPNREDRVSPVYNGGGPIVIKDAPNLFRQQEPTHKAQRPTANRPVRLRNEPQVSKIEESEPEVPFTSVPETSEEYILNPEEFDFPRKESVNSESAKEDDLEKRQSEEDSSALPLPGRRQRPQIHQKPHLPRNPSQEPTLQRANLYESQNIRQRNSPVEHRIRQNNPYEQHNLRQESSYEEVQRQRNPPKEQRVRQRNPYEEHNFRQRNPFDEEIHRQRNPPKEQRIRQNYPVQEQNVRQRAPPAKIPKRKKVVPQNILKQTKDYKKDKRAIYGGGGHLDNNGLQFADNLKHVEGGTKQDRIAFQMHGLKGPHSYRFGFDTGKGYNRQFRYEERDNHGQVKGRYGYYDNHGKLKIVNYSAHPKLGFKADVPKY